MACTTTGILSEVYAALTWQLTNSRARRVHDARRATAAIVAGVKSVFTYDASDRESFEGDGLSIAGPRTTLARLGRS